MMEFDRKEYRKAWKAKNADRLREQARAYNEANKEKIAAQKREYYLKNKERIIARNKAWQKDNRDLVNAHARKWRASNKDKVAELNKEWKAENKERWNAYNREYRAARTGMVNHYSKLRYCAKRKRTPAWADIGKIKAYYEVCAFFNEVNGYVKYHVDHIVPLNGELVSGLHVHNNLQVLPWRENIAKRNMFEV